MVGSCEKGWEDGRRGLVVCVGASAENTVDSYSAPGELWYSLFIASF